MLGESNISRRWSQKSKVESLETFDSVIQFFDLQTWRGLRDLRNVR
jgi:hypothetical protein